MLPELPPIDPDADPVEDARHAAEEVEAWLTLPSTRDELATAVWWFRRLRVLMGQIVGHDRELSDALMHAEKMRVLGELREAKAIGLGEAEYLEAVHQAGEWRRYAMRLREALDALYTYVDSAGEDAWPPLLSAEDALAEETPRWRTQTRAGRTD